MARVATCHRNRAVPSPTSSARPQADLGRAARRHRAFRRLRRPTGDEDFGFFLHVSRKEQKKRFTNRLDEPEKNWKFSASDVQERKFWSGYMYAFEEAIRVTASKHALWYVVPADMPDPDDAPDLPPVRRADRQAQGPRRDKARARGSRRSSS
jgi:polyphosphate kinase 2 (PPK2 family)